MKREARIRKQKGIALLMTIFALMLISAIGIGLLFSTDTETLISANYRDKQVATFAALAGLQEARVRIHPLNGDLALAGMVPTAVPPKGGTGAAPVVLYIINPTDGETVAPWDPSNAYFDNELCQENVLGLTGKPGVACTTYPSGTAWYQVVDNSTSGGVWQQAAPLPYKWVRIMLKSNAMSPLPIPDKPGTTTSTGLPLCFDGKHQASSTGGCGPKTKGVVSIAVTNGGSGYDINNPPAVSIDGGGGSGATAVAVLSPTPGNSVTRVKLDSAGSGYTSPPTVQFSGPGTLATAVATVGGKPVTSVSVSNGTPAACYPLGTAPQVAFDARYGSGATATVNMTTTACIASFSVTAACGTGNGHGNGNGNGNGNYAGKTATVTATGGFSGTVTFDSSGNLSNTSGTVTNPGSYTTMPTTASSSDLCAGATFKFNPGVHISSVSVVNGGDYTQAPTVSFTSTAFAGTKSTATAALGSANANTGTITGLTLTNGGTGYTTAPTITFVPNGVGGGATATAYIDSTYQISAINILSNGQDYTSNPTVTIAAPTSGMRATAQANIGYLNGGSGSATAQGSVYVLTAMAETKTKARSVAQMEVAVTYTNFVPSIGGALTLVGPSPTFGTPNANKFYVNGKDANSCGESGFASKPAIGVWDDPNNPTNPTSISLVTTALGKPNNYLGVKAAPDIENTYNNQVTPKALNDFVDSATAAALALPNHGHVYGPGYEPIPGQGGIDLGDCSKGIYAIDVVNGDYTMGPQTGCGILVVTGQLTISGDYGWKGLIFVIGKGASLMNGGGNGEIDGAVYVANTSSDTLLSPQASWNGGGGNGVIYDHCYADNLMGMIPSSPQVNADSLKILSTRMMEY